MLSGTQFVDITVNYSTATYRNHVKSKIITLLTLSFALSFILFVIFITDDLSRSREKLLRSPNIINVTDSISTRVMVTSENLPLDGAWTKADFDDSKWTSTKIPSNQLVKEKEYRIGNYAYYRIKIPKNTFKELPPLKNEVSLVLQYVLFSQVDILINGLSLKTTNPKSDIEYIQIIPVPNDQDIIVAIRGHIQDSVDTGIDHRAEILLGKSNELNELFVAGFKREISFQLVFLLCKGSILFIFALIFLLLKVDSSFSKFFYFGLCTIIEELISADYLSPFFDFHNQILIFNFANLGATVFVFLFFGDLLKVEIGKNRLWKLISCLAVVSTLMAFDVIGKNHYINIDTWLKFWNLMTVCVMVFYLPKAFKTQRLLSAVLLLAISLYLWSVAPEHNIGLNFKRYGNLLLFVMVAYQTFVIFRREQLLLQSTERRLLEQEKDVAIGKTASLLAHDVRKPLDQMKFVIEKLASGEVDKEFIEIAKKDIDFSIESVTQQVNDIMNFGRTSEVALKEISFYRILSHSIKQVMSIHPEMDLKLEYQFSTDNKILGDESRLSGILVNLISNAVEAIRDIGNTYKGMIRFQTSFYNNKFIFSIFNDGPAIPESIIDDIFRPLFTHGKSNGTGLGLSSVVKSVNALHGSISVKNIKDKGVEFELTFAVNPEIDNYEKSNFQISSKSYSYNKSFSPVEIENSDLRVLVLDIHKERMQKLLSEVPFKVSLSYASDIKTAKELISKMRFDLYLLNKDLGGMDIAEGELKFLNAEIVHYVNPEDIKELSKFCKNIYIQRKKILMVEDTKLFQVAWQMFHGPHNVECVSSPEEALQLLQHSNKQFEAYVLDFHFINSSLDGEALARKILEIREGAKVFISSSVDQRISGFQSISKRDYEIRKYLV